MNTTGVVGKWLLSPLLFCLVLSVSSFAKQGVCWQMESQLNSRCVYLEQENRKVDLQRAAKSDSQQLLSKIAQQITYGLTYRTDAHLSVINNPNASVDLTIFIANYVDNQLMSEDAYWQYYTHCDRWNVVFGESELIDLSDIEIIKRPSKMEAWMNIAKATVEISTKWLNDQIGRLEFVCIEQYDQFVDVAGWELDDHQEFAEPETTVEMVNVEEPVGMMEILKHELAGRWEPIFRLFKNMEIQSTAFNVPVENLLDDWLYDPFLELPSEMISADQNAMQIH